MVPENWLLLHFIHLYNIIMHRYFRVLATQSPWLQLLFFGVITSGSLILFTFAGQLIAIVAYGYEAYLNAMEMLQSPGAIPENPLQASNEAINILTITQITSQIGLFIVPPLLFARLLFGKQGPGYLATNTPPQTFTILMVLALIMMILPLIAWVTALNMAIPLPAALARAEEQAQRIMDLFFNDASVGRFILNMIMVAVIPAIGEEFFFRGVIQKHLTMAFKNGHLAILVTAIVFSFFHFQFHGFFPRILLGLLFGYLMLWSGSIWIPVIAHFINNGSAVIVEYLSQIGLIDAGYQEFGNETSTAAVMFSVVVTLLICFVIFKVEKQRNAIGHSDRGASL
jgi:uncharacterized protein